MKPHRRVALLSLVAISLGFVPAVLESAEVALPQHVIKDQNGVVVGGLSMSSTTGAATVLMNDPLSGENFEIRVAADFIAGADSTDVFFTNADCTGVAYVLAPSVFASLPELRGSVFAVGPTPTGGTSCCQVFRGAGPESNQDAAINSRFRASASDGYTCTAVDPGVDVVQAAAVIDLSHLVFPLVAE